MEKVITSSKFKEFIMSRLNFQSKFFLKYDFFLIVSQKWGNFLAQSSIFIFILLSIFYMLESNLYVFKYLVLSLDNIYRIWPLYVLNDLLLSLSFWTEMLEVWIVFFIFMYHERKLYFSMLDGSISQQWNI